MKVEPTIWSSDIGMRVAVEAGKRSSTMEGEGVSQFSGQRYLAIESYRKNGEAVKTPVWFVESQGTIYVRTANDTGKAKRIRRNPYVRIVPCNGRGTIKGNWVEAEAKFVPFEEADQVYLLLKQKYGLQYRLVGLLRALQRRRAKTAVLAIKTKTAE